MATLGRAWQAAGAAPVAAALLAAPWLDQRLVGCGWLGTALILTVGCGSRGWRGEAWTLATAAAALAAAFHWAPDVLAAAMNSDYAAGLLVAVPIVLWDAVRLALPFWFAARVTPRPVEAWLPAGLVAACSEAVVPAVFPWKLGAVQAVWPVTVQAVDLFGPEFASFMLFAHAGLVVWLGQAFGGWRAATGGGPKTGCVPGSFFTPPPAARLAVAACLLNAGYGAAAIAHWQRRAEAAPWFTAALVQANPEDPDGVEALRRLSRGRSAGDPAPDLVCWPECSGGCYEAGLDSLADPDRILARSRPPHGGLRPLENPPCPLLFGGKIFQGHPERPRAVHQSAILLDVEETIRGCSHKRYLMPFGEYVPGATLLPEIRLHFPLADEVTAGEGCQVLDWGGRPRLGVMLCYEDMVPAAARSLVAASANVLVSLVNGAAFTQPVSLAQHRLLAQLRAVENRRCLLRCAATGETCVISPSGAVVAALPPHGRGVLVARVPLLEDRPPALRLAPLFPSACGLAAGLIAIVAFRRSRRPVY